MATTYKKRRSGYEGESARAEAVRRMQTEARVRSVLNDSGPRGHGDRLPRSQQPTQKGPPQEQRRAAERARERSNSEREVTSHGGAPATPRPVDPKRPRIFNTTRGKRRLSYAEAYSHRTTDTSRARVMKLYGRKAPPHYRPRTAPTLTSPRAKYGNRLQNIARARAKLRRPRRQGGPFLRPRNRPRAYGKIVR